MASQQFPRAYLGREPGKRIVPSVSSLGVGFGEICVGTSIWVLASLSRDLASTRIQQKIRITGSPARAFEKVLVLMSKFFNGRASASYSNTRCLTRH
jgi:hypothetical protein